MKNTFKRILAALLCVVLLLGTLACTPEDSGDNPPDEPPTDGGQPGDGQEDAGLLIVGDGTAFYRVVRGDLESNTVRDASLALIDAVQSMTGTRPQPATDWEAYDENVKEIIVGKKNNRPATKEITDALEANTFRIVTMDRNVYIIGSDDATTTAAVEYFTRKYLSTSGDTLLLPEQIDTTISLLEWQTLNYQSTVTLKKAYSDYISDYDEKVLIYFEEDEPGYSAAFDGYIDEDHTIDEYGALRWDLKGKNQSVIKILNHTTTTFQFDASDKSKSTLKLWLYVSNTDNVVCDHDSGYGFQQNQATFFFRAIDKKGRTHSWNHTLTNNGWHEVELSFNIHNGVDNDFDYANVAGFWIGVATYDDVTIIVDSLRGVTYETDYTPEAIENETNPRLISDCEFDALDGAIIQEWYGASYDKDDKMQGQSSLRNSGDASVSDFRTVVADLDIPMDHEKDELVFHFKVADKRALANVFIELNQVQDTHEFSASFTPDALKTYGFGGEDNTWYEIRIPLSVFHVQLGEGLGDTVRLCNFRFVGSASGSAYYDYHIDHIYLAEK